MSVALCFPDSAAVSGFTILGCNPLAAASSSLRTCARTARREYSINARAMAADEPELVIDFFLTDLEGNLEYFDRWVAQSNAVRYKPGTTELELTHEGAYFVFGGDLMDRFDGSLRLARRIVDLKMKTPDRVFLLAGNRDLNKVRFTSELDDDDLRRPYTSIPGPLWDPHAPTLAQYLEKYLENPVCTTTFLPSASARAGAPRGRCLQFWRRHRAY